METENPQIKVEEQGINLEGQPTEPKTKALSDGSREETPSPTYKHSWTIQQRLTLANLAENFENSWKDITLVFNHVHKSSLQRCGGLRSEVVSTQYNDMMRRGFSTAAALRKIQATPFPFDRPNLVTRSQLEQKANEIGVELIPERPTNSSRIFFSDKQEVPSRKRKRIDPNDDSRTDFLPIRFQGVHSLSVRPKTPPNTKRNEPGNGLQTPPDSRQRKIRRLTADKRLARIGFRAFTTQSQGTYNSALGIRAGAFLNCPKVPLAQDLDVTTYRQEALHHITKYDHSRPSMFISVTKNPIRALHLLLRAPQGETSLVLIDLNAADESGNVEKARDLKIQTSFRYTAAGEYLIFGGVEPKAIISQIPLSRLLCNMPTTPSDDDPFKIQVLQAHEKLSSARYAIRKEVPPMTFSLGRAVGQLVGILRIPPKHFESGVWAIVQDFKFYNAEGAKKRGHWANNNAFKDGSIKGYQSIQPNTVLGIAIGRSIDSAREFIVIADDSEPDQASDEEDFTPIDVSDWVQNTQDNHSPLQYFDLETRQWMMREEGLSDGFLEELKESAATSDGNGPRDIAGDPGSSASDMNNLKAITVPAGEFIGELSNLDELCKDVMLMHGDEAVSPIQTEHNMDTDYEFGWTGM